MLDKSTEKIYLYNIIYSMIEEAVSKIKTGNNSLAFSLYEDIFLFLRNKFSI
jgi:hypothetical protein